MDVRVGYRLSIGKDNDGSVVLNKVTDGGKSLDGGRHISASQPIGGLSLDGSRQLSTSQPIDGLSLDGSCQLSTSQPIGGLSSDSGRQISAARPIGDGDGGRGSARVGGDGEMRGSSGVGGEGGGEQRGRKRTTPTGDSQSIIGAAGDRSPNQHVCPRLAPTSYARSADARRFNSKEKVCACMTTPIFDPYPSTVRRLAPDHKRVSPHCKP